MTHKVKRRKLGTDASHTRAMLKSLALALFKSERMKTTETRAKEVRGLVDKIITWAKRGDVHSRRLAIAALGDKDLVAKIFNDRERYEGRPGGYTRILKLGPRKGDSAPMVIMELVD
jgi:large subunit ribosomal protein L17